MDTDELDKIMMKQIEELCIKLLESNPRVRVIAALNAMRRELCINTNESVESKSMCMEESRLYHLNRLRQKNENQKKDVEL